MVTGRYLHKIPTLQQAERSMAAETKRQLTVPGLSSMVRHKLIQATMTILLSAAAIKGLSKIMYMLSFPETLLSARMKGDILSQALTDRYDMAEIRIPEILFMLAVMSL